MYACSPHLPGSRPCLTLPKPLLWVKPKQHWPGPPALLPEAGVPCRGIEGVPCRGKGWSFVHVRFALVLINCEVLSSEHH